eukprot:TRINITY_DN27911_c0_g1_i1.p1 TRINITY_DN27911_c0_g1~~TRINITY_DN27911_c0_g1_i1.p1  ORF type:complete len:140 (+),score=31.31 TRINITY_DN27911_c0_g1_i1:67-486(+)
MKTAKTIVDLLYYTEDEDLVVNCTQLGVIGVFEGFLIDNILSEEVVIKAFEEKLNDRISRFKNKIEYTENLFLDGSWDITGKTIGPKPFEYFTEKYSYLEDTLAIENIKKISYTYEYPIETIQKIQSLYKDINRILGEA